MRKKEYHKNKQVWKGWGGGEGHKNIAFEDYRNQGEHALEFLSWQGLGTEERAAQKIQDACLIGTSLRSYREAAVGKLKVL